MLDVPQASTSAALGSGATYTGNAYRDDNPEILVACKSDVAGTLYVDMSPDGSNWDRTSSFVVVAGVYEQHRLVKGSQWIRVRYVNGSSAQSYFRLLTTSGTFGSLPGAEGEPAADITTVQGAHGTYPINTGLPNLFGDLPVAEVTPAAQIDGIYGVLAAEHETYSAGGGSVTCTDSVFSAACTGTLGSYGVIRSRKPLRYRGGSMADFRLSAQFSSPVALTQQMAGAFNFEQGLFVGYNGTQFGVMQQRGGKAQLVRLTLSAGAGGTESITVTLNTGAFTFNVTVGAAAAVASQVAAQTFTGWAAYQNGSTVTFVAQAVGAKTGTYSLVNNTGGGTTAGTFATLQTGVAHTETWTYQGNWSHDKMDGSGSSGMTLDPTKGNLYRICFQWLGYGLIRFYVADDNDHDWELVHQIAWANANTSPSMRNPALKLGWVAYNLGGASGVTMQGACAGGFIHGKEVSYKRPNSISNSKTGVGTSFTNLVSIRNRAEFVNLINLSGLRPLLASVAVDGTKTCEARLVLNPTLGGTPNWTYVDQSTSSAEYDIAGTTVTGGRNLLSLSLGKSEARVVDIAQVADLFELEPNDVLCLAVKTTSTTTDATGALTWGRE